MPDKPASLPAHVAIVMDGNARWAKQHHLPVSAGHLRGASSVRHVIRLALNSAVPYLTLYAFSCDNWSRSLEEVSFLMSLFEKLLVKELNRFKKYGVRVVFIGDRPDLIQRAPFLEAPLQRVEEETFAGQALYLQIAINYSGQREICQAYQKMFAQGKGTCSPVELRKFLYMAPDVPYPDLLIRTSGEQRVSDFLLWYLAYTEFYFCNTYWPAFRADHWHHALSEYAHRHRRFGVRQPRIFK